MVKLNKGLLSLQLPLGYLSIMVYAGIEPDKARRDRVRRGREEGKESGGRGRERERGGRGRERERGVRGREEEGGQEGGNAIWFTVALF